MRESVAKWLISNPPKGDLTESKSENRFLLSCVFVFYNRIDLMENILHCICSQSLGSKDMEIILVEDKGGSEPGRSLVDAFPTLNVSHFAPKTGWGIMGYMRNYGLAQSSGKYVLFLDDDTVILDTDFIAKLLDRFERNENLQAVIPFGSASYAMIQDKYAYHDPYFFTNRCMAYRRSCLLEMRGFDSGFVGQEDVEFAIRFIASGYEAYRANDLCYYHPPLVYRDSGKGFAVGASFARSKYSFIVKLLLGLNGIRWLPLGLIPKPEYRNKALFAWGFAKGFIKGLSNKKSKVDYT